MPVAATPGPRVVCIVPRLPALRRLPAAAAAFGAPRLVAARDRLARAGAGPLARTRSQVLKQCRQRGLLLDNVWTGLLEVSSEVINWCAYSRPSRIGRRRMRAVASCAIGIG